ncbi:hypothetical protein AAE478_004165 [Parahypoxylon ruwenzoriense]
MDLSSTSSAQVTAPGIRKSVPYGQACTNCSKAKCKCINRGSPGAICERCQRLGKECRPSVSVRKRAVRRPASERTAHLEEKLDDLVSILRAQATSNPAASPYRTPGSSDLSGVAAGVSQNIASALDLNGCMGAMPGSNKTAIDGHAMPPAEIAVSHSYPNTASPYPTPPSVASSQDVGLSPAEAEETLQLFRDQYLQFFPFVYISPETTAVQLQQTRPFLWLNIRTVCCRSTSQKAALNQRVREVAAQRMLLDLDRNIDLLLGLLAYLGWGMHHFNGKPYIVAYLGLALSVVTDLRLDKPPQENFYKDLHCFKPSYPYSKVGCSSGRSNEERRALLGCFIYCSTISNFLRNQTMRWTAHMEDSLQKLSADPECLNDEILVAMVKSHKILEDVAHITWRSADPPGQLMSSRALPVAYGKALRANLEAMKRDLSPVLLEHKVVIGYINAADLAIADMSLWNINPWFSSGPPKTANTSGSVDIGKIDAYYGSLQASKAGLENYLSFPLTDYVGFSFAHTIQLGRAAQTLYRLMVVDDPEWDRTIAKNSIDLMAAMEQIADNFMRVSAVCGVDTSDSPECSDYYSKAANAFRGTIPTWTATLEQVGLGAGVGTGAETGAAPAAVDQMPAAGIPEFTSMEWLDEPWLTDMLRSWEAA